MFDDQKWAHICRFGTYGSDTACLCRLTPDNREIPYVDVGQRSALGDCRLSRFLAYTLVIAKNILLNVNFENNLVNT